MLGGDSVSTSCRVFVTVHHVVVLYCIVGYTTIYISIVFMGLWEIPSLGHSAAMSIFVQVFC